MYPGFSCKTAGLQESGLGEGVLLRVPDDEAAEDANVDEREVALLQWFEEQNPSTAFGGAYSFPDPSTLRALSPVTRPIFDKNGNLIACTTTPRP